uniref:Uncharacterized protein n=1 Tax=Anguilla anguilla TaxID=7936 RepID=A0A0E9XAJ5_ANGAN
MTVLIPTIRCQIFTQFLGVIKWFVQPYGYPLFPCDFSSNAPPPSRNLNILLGPGI